MPHGVCRGREGKEDKPFYISIHNMNQVLRRSCARGCRATSPEVSTASLDQWMLCVCRNLLKRYALLHACAHTVALTRPGTELHGDMIHRLPWQLGRAKACPSPIGFWGGVCVGEMPRSVLRPSPTLGGAQRNLT